MTRNLFLVWTIYVIHWISLYRANLEKTIRDKRALLIMDGHGSRECPLALYLFKCNEIDILILPAHTAYITQMFDVCLAHPLKQLSAKLMKQLIIGNENYALTINHLCDELHVEEIVNLKFLLC